MTGKLGSFYGRGAVEGRRKHIAVDTILTVLERDQDRCVRCDVPCTGFFTRDWTIHERRARMASGYKGSDKAGIKRLPGDDQPSNLLTVCGNESGEGCSGWMSEFRTEAIRNGWVIEDRTVSPAEVPIYMPYGNGAYAPAYLDNEGQITRWPSSWVAQAA